ncbi:hypothetical protein EBX31_04435 [bacterium]|nr:hypothetical protein [bacterium]
MQKILLSFASGKYLIGQEYLIESGRPYFTGHASYRPEFLDSEFVKKHQQILAAPKGAGYWLWKPQILRETLARVADGDFVFYVDSGNLIIGNPQPLFDLCALDPRGVLLFDNRDGKDDGTPWQNAAWTKMDCYRRMGCEGDRFTQANKVNGSYILIRKCKFSCAFVEEYLRWCCTDDLLTDAPSRLGAELPVFQTHRHDQSILSLLAARDGILLARDPSEWGNRFSDRINPEYGQIFRHHRSLLHAHKDNLLLKHGARLPSEPTPFQIWLQATRHWLRQS